MNQIYQNTLLENTEIRTYSIYSIYSLISYHCLPDEHRDGHETVESAEHHYLHDSNLSNPAASDSVSFSHENQQNHKQDSAGKLQKPACGVIIVHN